MRSEKISFPSGQGSLEGLYQNQSKTKAVVITHPHPLYGGDMFNPVVEAITTAYEKCDFTTLRFNFRGTGKSTGTFANGIGEQDDVMAAVAYLNDLGFAEIHLSGYSFGAWVNAAVLQDPDRLSVSQLTMVAPPVAFMEFKPGTHLPTLSTVVAGSEDEIAPPSLIQPLIGQWNPSARFTVIQGADHFFFGYLDELVIELTQSLRLPKASKI
ncbi:Alpha/beta hydrolase family protein [Desulfosarcina cetonica]|uniref:alpha/beta hydrolase n=1 Tax=Desulfosarcina cetonica TaxID=90730 RepID=UPI0006CF4C86|nr:hypothetical protein [Desulfosarcina cetonica]VTR68518.1 Alpha/beta hydrolase family protein [Desulfosarcina cetonica]